METGNIQQTEPGIAVTLIGKLNTANAIADKIYERSRRIHYAPAPSDAAPRTQEASEEFSVQLSGGLDALIDRLDAANDNLRGFIG